MKRKTLLLIISAIILIIVSAVIIFVFLFSSGSKGKTALEEKLGLGAQDVEKVVVHEYLTLKRLESTDPAVIQDIFKKLSIQEYEPHPEREVREGGVQYWINFYPKGASSGEKHYATVTSTGSFTRYDPSQPQSEGVPHVSIEDSPAYEKVFEDIFNSLKTTES